MTCLDNKMSFPETWTTALKMHKEKVYVKVVSPYLKKKKKSQLLSFNITQDCSM